MLVLGGRADAQGRPATELAPTEEAATTQARSLFNDGTESARRGQWSLALTAFERSEALHPHAVTTYDIAYCERALGHYTRAHRAFDLALAESASRGGGELPEDLAAAARTYLSELDAQIARPVVSVSPEGASILVDGRPLERAVKEGSRQVFWAGTREPGEPELVGASSFELHIDPGAHVFVVSRSGYAESASTHTFEAGAEASVVLQLTPLAEALPRRPVATNGDPPVGGPARARSRIPAYVVLGVGAAGLATGLTAGLLAIDFKGEGQAHYAQAGTAADVATATFIVGGVGVAAGAILWWLTPGEEPAPRHLTTAGGGRHGVARSEIAVRPWVLPGYGGMLGTF
jgi:hypothetical protein